VKRGRWGGKSEQTVPINAVGTTIPSEGAVATMKYQFLLPLGKYIIDIS
jgi:hypothetical protein